MKKRIILTLLTLCISLSITFAYANPILIGGLEIPPGSDVPHQGGNAFIILRQFDNNCGPTSVQMVLHYYGIRETLARIQIEGGITTVAAGTRPNQLLDALNNLKVPATWYEDDKMPGGDPYTYLKSCINESRPPIILIKVADGAYHWVVVVGYNDKSSPEEYLIADPNGKFEWYEEYDLKIRWNFTLQSCMDPDQIKRLGAFTIEKAGNTAIDFFTSIGSGQYTIIVPNNPPDPNQHFPGYWSDMEGGQYEGLDKWNWFGENVSERTFETKEFNPFDFYQISWRKLLTSASVAELVEHEKVEGNKVRFTGRFTEGALLPGKIWVVVRTYRLEPVNFPDMNLLALIEAELGKKTGDPITSADLQNLTYLHAANKEITELTGLQYATKLSVLNLGDNPISDITPLEKLTELTSLQLYRTGISDIMPLTALINLSSLSLKGNAISDITPLEGLTNLEQLYLGDNDISDITPLVNNTGIGTDDSVDLRKNLLRYEALNTDIPALEARGGTVTFDDRTPKNLKIISGVDNQPVALGDKLIEPFIVEVKDQGGVTFEGVPVTFKLTAGDGTLSHTNTTTDKKGQAQTTLTVGDKFLAHTITVSASDITPTLTFTYDAIMNIDVNKDGLLDVNDLALVIANFGATIAPDVTPNPDVNGDGNVDEQDFLLVSDSILVQEKAGVSAAPATYIQVIPRLTAETVEKWILEIKQRSNGDPRFDGGIALLEQLLASIRPEKTSLLPNYPNPFNPETWIPYQLAKPADVTLTIYDTQGRVVRDLDLGHQRAGVYHSRSRAVHWDGRNAQGESVANGIYFYTLKAGDFDATRKMLIRK